MSREGLYNERNIQATQLDFQQFCVVFMRFTFSELKMFRHSYSGFRITTLVPVGQLHGEQRKTSISQQTIQIHIHTHPPLYTPIL